MANKLQSIIESIVERAVSEIAQLTRSGASAETVRAAVTHAAPAVAHKPPAAKGPRKAARSSGSFQRRSPEEILAETTKVLAFVKAHPGLRSEQIQAKTGLGKPSGASSLVRLRDSGTVRMTGVKRAATYTAA